MLLTLAFKASKLLLKMVEFELNLVDGLCQLVNLALNRCYFERLRGGVAGEQMGEAGGSSLAYVHLGVGLSDSWEEPKLPNRTRDLFGPSLIDIQRKLNYCAFLYMVGDYQLEM